MQETAAVGAEFAAEASDPATGSELLVIHNPTHYTYCKATLVTLFTLFAHSLHSLQKGRS